MSGKLAYGYRVPSIQQLARDLNTSIFTVQTALTPLVEEGLLERTPGRGTFVRGRANQLANVALYFGSNFWENAEGAFYRELYQELVRELAIDHCRHKLWIDTRPSSERGTPLPEMEKALQDRSFQGVVATQIDSACVPWLSRLKSPLVAFGTMPISSRVTLDPRQMIAQGLQELKRQECRSVGLISPFPAWGLLESDHAKEIVQFHQEFVDLSRDMGLEIRSEWVRTPATHFSSDKYEAYGYEQFQSIWRQPQRPDGLLVHPDLICKGVIMAVLQNGISVPRDLKLVLHRNEGIPVLCPLPASWQVTSVRQCALAIIEQMKRLLAGKNVQPTYVSLGLETSEGHQ